MSDQDQKIAAAARQAGLAARGTDEQLADVMRVVGAVFEQMIAALRPLLVATWAEFARKVAPLVDIYERGELRRVLSADRSCHCLCPMHRDAGMFCTSIRAKVVTLTGGIEPVVHVPMCLPCADWWAWFRPDRAVHIGDVARDGASA